MTIVLCLLSSTVSNKHLYIYWHVLILCVFSIFYTAALVHNA